MLELRVGKEVRHCSEREECSDEETLAGNLEGTMIREGGSWKYRRKEEDRRKVNGEEVGEKDS